MRPGLSVSSVLALVLLACGACGGGKKPAASTHAKDAAPPETFAEVNPADLAELDAGSAPAPAASSSSSASSGPASPPDDCTPVGVDFEKRARPKLKDCYAQGKKKDPNLTGTVRLAVEIGPTGKVKSTKVAEKTLPDAVTQCMLKVLKATPLPDASKCPGRTLTIPMSFPTN
ncbi:MAG: hypothetical protein JWP97_3231 [Labilithrix sp.]|nr:hypothetical protein [Labilithrix sp.]